MKAMCPQATTLWSIFAFGVLLSVNGSPVLTPSEVYSCPGERVTFTCVVNNGHQLFWEVDFLSGSLPDIRSQRYLSIDPPGLHKPANPFDFILISNSPTLISNASTSVQLAMEGTQVYCKDENAVHDISVIHVIQGPISIGNVTIDDTKPTENNTVAILIHVSTNNSREIHKLYFVTVFPSVDSGPSTFTTENNTFQLSLLYNHEYAVSVVAKNCAGNSTPVNITVNITQDMSPMHSSNVTIDSDNDVEVEGRDENPNNLVDCGVPTVLKGARILPDFNTTAQITLICTEGPFSNLTITSVCSREGQWHPDPAKFSCLPETSSGQPHSKRHSNSVGYVITGVCTSIVFYILGVISVISFQWCHRQKGCCKISHVNGPQGAQGEPPDEPVYAECSLPISSQGFNTVCNAAYQHPQVQNNMHIYC